MEYRAAGAYEGDIGLACELVCLQPVPGVEIIAPVFLKVDDASRVVVCPSMAIYPPLSHRDA